MRLIPCPLAATLFCLLAPGWAMACQGQAGKTIFEDDFSDDSGGWDLGSPDIKIKDSALVVTFTGQSVAHLTMVPAFKVPEGNFCVDVVLPPSPGPDNNYAVQLNFWEPDYANRYTAVVYSYGGVGLDTMTDSKDTYIGGVLKAPSFLAGASATNELRAVVKGGKVTIFLNGTKIKAFRVQQPTGPLHFGLGGQLDKPNPAAAPIRITHFKVTSGE